MILDYLVKNIFIVHLTLLLCVVDGEDAYQRHVLWPERRQKTPRSPGGTDWKHTGACVCVCVRACACVCVCVCDGWEGLNSSRCIVSEWCVIFSLNQTLI